MMEYQNLTPEDILKTIDTIYCAKYTSRFCFGFSNNVQDDVVWSIDYDFFNQDGKHLFIMKPNGKVHKKILEWESQHTVKFDRLDNKHYCKLYSFMICCEDGSEINPFTLEPRWCIYNESTRLNFNFNYNPYITIDHLSIL